MTERLAILLNRPQRGDGLHAWREEAADLNASTADTHVVRPGRRVGAVVVHVEPVAPVTLAEALHRAGYRLACLAPCLDTPVSMRTLGFADVSVPSMPTASRLTSRPAPRRVKRRAVAEQRRPAQNRPFLAEQRGPSRPFGGFVGPGAERAQREATAPAPTRSKRNRRRRRPGRREREAMRK